jgi:hypothetical protein
VAHPATTISTYRPGVFRSIPFRSLLVPLDFAQIVLTFLVLYMAMHLQLMWLRSFTMNTVIWIGGYLGMHMEAVRPDLMRYRGRLYEFALVCTYAHLYLALACILWNRRRTVVHNLLRLSAFGGFLFVLNIVRLEAVFLLPDDPRELAHTLVTGFTGLLVYLAVVYQIEHPFAWFLTHGPDEPFRSHSPDSPLHIAFPAA